jgi:hypothetical protein
MYLIIDDHLADKDEINLILQQPGGPQRIAGIIKSTAVAFAVDNLHGYLLTDKQVLKKQLSDEILNDMCNLIWTCLFKSGEKSLDDYVLKVAERIEEKKLNAFWCPRDKEMDN